MKRRRILLISSIQTPTLHLVAKKTKQHKKWKYIKFTLYQLHKWKNVGNFLSNQTPQKKYTTGKRKKKRKTKPTQSIHKLTLWLLKQHSSFMVKTITQKKKEKKN